MRKIPKRNVTILFQKIMAKLITLSSPVTKFLWYGDLLTVEAMDVKPITHSVI